MALGTDYIIRYLSDTKDAMAGAKALEQLNTSIAANIGSSYANMTRIVGTNFGKISGQKLDVNGTEVLKTMQEMTFVTQNAEGKFFELQGVLTKVGDETSLKLNPALKDTTNQFTKGAVESEKASKNFKDMGQNIATLASRAVLTIPIWIALRSAVMGTISSITNGFNDLVNESLALQKVKNTISGTASDITGSMELITKATQSLALESGVSHEKIIATFQKFSSVGLDVATSLAATNAAIKLSVITQTDAIATSESLAHAFSVLINANASAGEKQKEINEIVSLTSELWKTNGFNLTEFTGSLEKFAITAKSVNFTTNQTLALLATLSKSGLGSAGNLLRNSIGQLLVNMDKLAASLGVHVNPVLDDTFSILMKVLEQINNLQKTNDLKGLESAKDALKDIFGGTRSAVPVTALAALFDVLKKNVSLTGDVNKLNDSFKDTESVLGNVVARFHTANSEIGKALVNGIVGGDDFNSSLENIVETLSKMINVAHGAGEAVAGVFSLGTLPVLSTWKKSIDENNKSIMDLSDSIVNGMQGKLNQVDFTALLNKLEVARKQIGVEINESFDDKDAEKRIAAARRLNDTINLIKKAGPLVEPTQADDTSKQTNAIEKQTIAIKDAQAIAKSIVSFNADRLKQEGALTSQVLIATQLRINQLGIEEQAIDKLNRKLEIEKAINEEKRLQGRLSSDTMKLFDIAKTEGIQIAKQVGDVLAGNTDFDMFIRRGGQAVEVFKKEFSDLFKQQQAQQFFTGERVSGLPGLNQGSQIAIQEEALRNPQLRLPAGQEQAIQRLTNINTTVPVSVTASIDISKLEEIKTKFVEEVTKQLPQVGTDINNALVQALAGKQGNSL
jgi:TP901 family phage tail tape measure protein